MMKGKTGCGTIAHWLILIGALNWGLIGLGYFFNEYWNVIYLFVGLYLPMAENIMYILIGASALAMLLGCRKSCPCD